MKNFWLDRRPKLFKQDNPYAEHYGKWYILKGDSQDTFRYLHKDGSWRVSAWNPQTGDYTGYFDSENAAQQFLDSLSDLILA
jgi:hypothetical protein